MFLLYILQHVRAISPVTRFHVEPPRFSHLAAVVLDGQLATGGFLILLRQTDHPLLQPICQTVASAQSVVIL